MISRMPASSSEARRHMLKAYFRSRAPLRAVGLAASHCPQPMPPQIPASPSRAHRSRYRASSSKSESDGAHGFPCMDKRLSGCPQMDGLLEGSSPLCDHRQTLKRRGANTVSLLSCRAKAIASLKCAAAGARSFSANAVNPNQRVAVSHKSSGSPTRDQRQSGTRTTSAPSDSPSARRQSGPGGSRTMLRAQRSPIERNRLALS